MKKIILLIVALCSSSLFAANVGWIDLKQGQEYKIALDVVFENDVTLPANDVYELHAIEPLVIEGFPLIYYSFHQKSCTKPGQTADISIMKVSDEDQDIAVVIELKEGCHFGLYLDKRDYYFISPFKAIK